MIRFYIKKHQLHNFFDLKEPIVFEPLDNMQTDVVELNISHKKLMFTEYKTYITVELKTFRKSFLGGVLWKRN